MHATLRMEPTPSDSFFGFAFQEAASFLEGCGERQALYRRLLIDESSVDFFNLKERSDGC